MLDRHSCRQIRNRPWSQTSTIIIARKMTTMWAHSKSRVDSLSWSPLPCREIKLPPWMDRQLLSSKLGQPKSPIILLSRMPRKQRISSELSELNNHEWSVAQWVHAFKAKRRECVSWQSPKQPWFKGRKEPSAKISSSIDKRITKKTIKSKKMLQVMIIMKRTMMKKRRHQATTNLATTTNTPIHTKQLRKRKIRHLCKVLPLRSKSRKLLNLEN